MSEGPFLLIPVFLGLLIGGAVAYVHHRMKNKRREDLFKLAHDNGLTYLHRDPLGTLALPFELFRKGDKRGCENVIYGTLKDTPVRVFDFWYYVETVDQQGNTSRTYHRFTCSVLDLQQVLFWPHLTIGREEIFSRIKDRVGFRDIQFESDEFNRTFEVHCPDKRFASALIDPRMMQWLLSTDADYSFEVSGRHILCATRRLDAASFLRLHHIVTDFSRRIPNVVATLYPAARRPA